MWLFSAVAHHYYHEVSLHARSFRVFHITMCADGTENVKFNYIHFKLGSGKLCFSFMTFQQLNL